MKFTLPKRTRIILLFLLGIGLPSLLLGDLAFRGVQPALNSSSETAIVGSGLDSIRRAMGVPKKELPQSPDRLPTGD